MKVVTTSFVNNGPLGEQRTRLVPKVFLFLEELLSPQPEQSIKYLRSREYVAT